MDLNKILLEQLECPICNEYMHPPIVECLNGHNFCSRCIYQMKSCGLCRADISDSARNLPLEQIHHETIIPCTNRADGCPRKELGSIMAKHEGYCGFGYKNCPLNDSHGCSWQGRFSDMILHLNVRHEDSMHYTDRTCLIFRDFNNQQAFTGRRYFAQILKVQKVLFKVVLQMVQVQAYKQATFGVLVVNRESEKFEYQVDLCSERGDTYTSKQPCDIMIQGKQCLYGYPNLLPLNYNMARSYCVGDDLYFGVTITKV